jgi:hypothetical protein
MWSTRTTSGLPWSPVLRNTFWSTDWSTLLVYYEVYNWSTTSAMVTTGLLPVYWSTTGLLLVYFWSTTGLLLVYYSSLLVHVSDAYIPEGKICPAIKPGAPRRFPPETRRKLNCLGPTPQDSCSYLADSTITLQHSPFGCFSNFQLVESCCINPPHPLL